MKKVIEFFKTLIVQFGRMFYQISLLCFSAKVFHCVLYLWLIFIKKDSQNDCPSVVPSVSINLLRVKIFYIEHYFLVKFKHKKPAIMQVYSFYFLLCSVVFCKCEISLFHARILRTILDYHICTKPPTAD